MFHWQSNLNFHCGGRGKILPDNLNFHCGGLNFHCRGHLFNSHGGVIFHCRGATQENAEESAQSWRDFCGVVFQELFHGISIAVNIQEQLRRAFYIVQIPARVIPLKRARPIGAICYRMAVALGVVWRYLLSVIN